MYNRLVPRNGESAVLTAATRVSHSLFLFCFLVLVLYLLGNFQEFLDDSQLLLLGIVRVAALVGTLLGGYCMAFRVWLAVRGTPSRGWSLAVDAVVFVINAAVLAGVQMLFAWLQISAA